MMSPGALHLIGELRSGETLFTSQRRLTELLRAGAGRPPLLRVRRPDVRSLTP